MRKKGRSFARRVDPLAAFRSAGRQHPLDDSQKISLGVALRTHLEALRTGTACELAFHNLANGVNVSMILAEKTGLGSEFDEVIGEAQQAMLFLKINGTRKGRWLLDGKSLSWLMRWLDVYEAQLEVVSQQEAIDALDEVTKRVQRGLVFDQPMEVAA